MKKINGFYYLKIFAATIIVLHHYQQVFDCKFGFINFYDGNIQFGYLVELFFIISGFLMYHTDSKNNNITRKKKLLKKVVRIYSVSILSVIVCFLLTYLRSSFNEDIILSELINIKTVIANIFLCLLDTLILK